MRQQKRSLPSYNSPVNTQESQVDSQVSSDVEKSNEASDHKVCPICQRNLTFSEFGICRARKDGRNLYCKSCIRQKVTQSRRALKEYKSARKGYISQQVKISDLLNGGVSNSTHYTAKSLSKLSPIERVRDAIRRGSRTQREIARETKLGEDEIRDALANLLLWTQEIETRREKNNRASLSTK